MMHPTPVKPQRVFSDASWVAVTPATPSDTVEHDPDNSKSPIIPSNQACQSFMTEVQRNPFKLEKDHQHKPGDFEHDLLLYTYPRPTFIEAGQYETAEKDGHRLDTQKLGQLVDAFDSFDPSAVEKVHLEESVGETIADQIEWNRRLFDGSELDECGDERQALINDINDGKPLQYCTVCKKCHIPWGPPITLQDRDTCYSMLPEWFPRDKYHRPWDAYTMLVNRSLDQDNVDGGRSERERLASEMQYHAPSEEWHRPELVDGGYWKCREAGVNVPEVENKCPKCHNCKLVDPLQIKALEDWILRRLRGETSQDTNEALHKFYL